jgi:diguanylate cyclase
MDIRSPRQTKFAAPLLTIFVGGIALGLYFWDAAAPVLPQFAHAHGSPLTSHHNQGLVVLSFLISIFASYTALDLTGRARGSRGLRRRLWLAGSSLAMGGGIWSMHFVAMVAFDLGMPITYDLRLTVLSFVVAVAVTSIGLGAVIRSHGSRVSLLAGGVFMGLGVASMHYTGMAAMRMDAHISYDPLLFIVSVVIAIVASVVALWLAFNLNSFWYKTAAAGVMGAAVCGMHFTAMAAAVYTPMHAAPAASTVVISPELVGLATAGSSFALLSLGLLCSLGSQYFTAQGAKAKLAESEERFRRLADATFEGILLQDGGSILDANESLVAMLGRTSDEVIGHHLLTLFAPESHDVIANNMCVDAAAPYEATAVRKDGTELLVELHSKPMPYDGRHVHVVAVRDVTERKRSEERIQFLAHHDALTRLPNRVLFRDRLERALARANRSGETLAVLSLDLDRFKEINDCLGHPTGDDLLVAVAERLSSCLREVDTVARLGGDEFAIIQIGSRQPEGAATLARRVLDALAPPFDLGEHHCTTGASIGIAITPDGGDDPDRLLKNSDIALYRAKAETRSGFVFFEEEMNAGLQTRRALEQTLRRALDFNEFELHYQPQVDLETRATVGFEALLRWRHPDGHLVSPAEFVPVAEETGLILRLGAWVLRQACEQAVRWPGQPKIAVNLSPVQFKHGDLVALVADALAESGLEPGRLELEITESVILHDTDATLVTLQRLKALGVHIAMDDFGTGYSSLSHLRKFPFNRIKIDRSFIQDVVDNTGDAAIVRAVIDLGRSLGMSVTAEGVETEHQLEYLTAESCNQAQGYHLGRPVAMNALTETLFAEEPRPASALPAEEVQVVAVRGDTSTPR